MEKNQLSYTGKFFYTNLSFLSDFPKNILELDFSTGFSKVFPRNILDLDFLGKLDQTSIWKTFGKD